MQRIVVIGDHTDHGGNVITSALTTDTDGMKWARKGDMVSCPRCHGVFPIVQGDEGFIVEGAPVAYDGCKTACGARLIAGGQTRTFTDPRSGAGGIAGSGGAAGSIGAGLIGAYENEQSGHDAERFRGRFKVVDEMTGEPVPKIGVRVKSSSGQHWEGVTDEGGLTQWVERDTQETLSFELLEATTTA